MLHISVSAYKQAEAERKSDPIFRKVGGGGTCMRPGRGSSSGSSADNETAIFWLIQKGAFLQTKVASASSSGI